LAWAVPGDLTAAINIDDLCAIGRSFGIFGSLARCVGTLVLKQYHGVWPSASNYLFMSLALKGKCVQVGDKVRTQACGEKFRHAYKSKSYPENQFSTPG
jgi:hypothetical protein